MAPKVCHACEKTNATFGVRFDSPILSWFGAGPHVEGLYQQEELYNISWQGDRYTLSPIMEVENHPK